MSFNFSVADVGGGIGSTTMIFARVLRGTIERREGMSNNTGGLEDSMEDSSLTPCKSWSNRKSSFYADFRSRVSWTHSHTDLKVQSPM
jgi:hypothetical protein